MRGKLYEKSLPQTLPGQKKCSKCGRSRGNRYYRTIGWNLEQPLCKMCDGNLVVTGKMTLPKHLDADEKKELLNQRLKEGEIKVCPTCDNNFFASEENKDFCDICTKQSLMSNGIVRHRKKYVGGNIE